MYSDMAGWALAIIPQLKPFAGKGLRVNANRPKKVELHGIQGGIADSRGAVRLKMAKVHGRDS